MKLFKKFNRVVALLGISLTCQGYADERQAPLDQVEDEMAYFVSFSIPEKQLVVLLQAAERNNLPIYIRGLVNDDMKSTAKAIQYLAAKYGIQGINIDPIRFDYYGIQAVPALVKRCGSKFDVVYGNGTITHALELIEQQGECK